MAKEAPTFSVALDDGTGAAQTISNDVTTLDFATPRGVQDVTGVNKTSVERLLLLADFSATLAGVFNDAANLSHAVLRTVPSTSQTRLLTLAASGQTLAVETLVTDYALAKALTGELTWRAPCVGQGTTDPPTWA